jgi:hypothetical protein
VLLRSHLCVDLPTHRWILPRTIRFTMSAPPQSTIDPSARLITPEGLPLAILAISCIFLGLSLIAVSLRTYIRFTKGIFGLDDAFMAIGTVRLPFFTWT